MPPLQVKERICFSCPTEVEDELDFFNCPVYQALNEFRNLLNYIIISNNLPDIENGFIRISLLEDHHLNYLLARFIVKANETRNNLINCM